MWQQKLSHIEGTKWTPLYAYVNNFYNNNCVIYIPRLKYPIKLVNKQSYSVISESLFLHFKEKYDSFMLFHRLYTENIARKIVRNMKLSKSNFEKKN